MAVLLRNEYRVGEIKASDFFDKSKLLQDSRKDNEKVIKAIEIYKKRAKIISASAKQILDFSEIILKVAFGTIVIAFLFLVIAFWSVPLQNLSLADPDTTQSDKSKAVKKGENERLAGIKRGPNIFDDLKHFGNIVGLHFYGNAR